MADSDLRQYSMAYDMQCHYGVFYGFLKLKELEIKSICWLTELVTQRLDPADPRWNNFTVPFNIYWSSIDILILKIEFTYDST